MKWSRPKWIWSKLWFSTKMNHIWTWPIHFGRDHFILVKTKSLWSSPNQFGQTKTILDRPKLFWSHRRTRHKYINPEFHKKLSNVIITLNWFLFFHCLFIFFCPLGMFQSIQNGNLQSGMHRRRNHRWISWEKNYLNASFLRKKSKSIVWIGQLSNWLTTSDGFSIKVTAY